MTWRSDGYGSFREPWLPCEMHGIVYRECWGCNKPRGLCDYGYCGRVATHVGAGRFCCEPHAGVLADMNGDGMSKPIDPAVARHLAAGLVEARIVAATP